MKQLHWLRISRIGETCHCLTTNNSYIQINFRPTFRTNTKYSDDDESVANGKDTKNDVVDIIFEDNKSGNYEFSHHSEENSIVIEDNTNNKLL